MGSAASHSCCFCRVTQLGFLRLSTNRKVFPLDALPLDEAWRVYDELLRDERVAFADEPEEIEAAWRNATRLKKFSTNLWSDAYLAAFARPADWEIVNFDRGFAHFKDLRHTILT